jgi:hypothetical protein
MKLLFACPRRLTQQDYKDLLIISHREATANSKATQEQVDKLASDVKKGWWKKNRKRFLK